MAIKVSCQCGKQLSVKDDFAGRRVKCPGCGGPLLIPQPQAAALDDDGISDLLDDAGMRAGVSRCPGCGAELSEESVLCVMCGFDLRRGHRLKARIGSANEFDDEELGDLPVHGVAQLDEAERAMARDKIQQKTLGKGAPWWMILLAFVGVVGFTVGMVMMPQDRVLTTSSVVIQVAGVLLSLYFAVLLIINAFQDSVLHGLLVLFLPFPFWFIYVFARWDRVGGIFLGIMAGWGLQLIGFGMIALAPWVKSLGKDEDEFSLRMWQNRPVAVQTFQDMANI